MSDEKILLRQAVHELRDLRRRNEILAAQMFVVEAFHAALLGPPRSGGMSPDLAWQIEASRNCRHEREGRLTWEKLASAARAP